MSQECNTASDLYQGNLLRSSELFAHRKPGEKSLPKKGAKDYSPDGSWLHQHRLEIFSEGRNSLLSEQRVEKLGNVVKGKWNPEKELVELEKELGKFWAYMGFVDQHRKWLYPEEALFLMETSVLEVWYGSVPVSIQQAYSSFLGKDVQFEEYQVYAHLRRLGFVVIRHRGPSEVTRYERQIRLDQHIVKHKGKRKLEKKDDDPNDGCASSEDSSSAIPGTDSVRTEREVKPSKRAKLPALAASSDTCSSDHITLVSSEDKSMVVEDSHSAFEKNMSEDFLNVADMEENETDSAGNVSESVANVEMEFHTGSTKGLCNLVDFSHINIPSVFGQQKVILEAPPSELLPQNIIFPGHSYEINLSKIPINVAREKKSKQSQEQPKNSDFEFSFHHIMNKSAYKDIKAKNWKDYKSQKCLLDRNFQQAENSPLAHLWTGEVTPLVSPLDGVCTCSLLQNLSVIKECGMKQDISTVAEESPIRVVFDVYQPDSKFRKSTPGLPHFRIFVQKQSETPPNLYQIAEVTQRLDDDVALLCAVVDSGDIALYTFNAVSLPFDISMG